MFITQTPEEIKLSLELNANSAINAVRLAAASLWCSPSDKFMAGVAAESEVSFRPGEFRLVERSLVLGVDFKFIARVSGETPKPQNLIKISCVLEAVYSLRPGFDPSDDQIKAFQSGNAVFNCWPYFREFIQNSVVRMHMPPPPVPFLRLMPPKKADARKVKRPAATKALNEAKPE
jgi:hypothetical protein